MEDVSMISAREEVDWDEYYTPEGKLRVEYYFIPKGCDGCRGIQRRCNGTRPLSCKRCTSMSLTCTWPLPQLKLCWKRRGITSYQSRNRQRVVPEILPNLPMRSPQEAHMANEPEENVQSNYITMTDDDDADSSMLNEEVSPEDISDFSEVHNHEDVQSGSNVPTYLSSFLSNDMSFVEGLDMASFNVQGEASLFANLLDLTDPDTSHNGNHDIESFDVQEGFNSLTNFSGYGSSDANLQGYLSIGSTLFDSMSFQQVQSASSTMIGASEHDALGHYQTIFSIYRTTKNPRWSTHSLLLNKSKSDPMILNFILAVSIDDLSYRKTGFSSSEAHNYFQLAEAAFDLTIKRDLGANHKTALTSFLLLYLYLPKRTSASRDRVQQLSRDVYEYIIKHRLDSQCLERTSFSRDVSHLSSQDRTLMARLIIWIWDEDVKCCFQGYGGFLARYLTAHRERTLAVYEVSRTALEDCWGEDYPPDEVKDDDDNAIELEFLWAQTTLWQEINQLDPQSEEFPISKRHLEQRFTLLEKKYSTVFQNSTQNTMPRTRALVNSDYDIVLFNSLKVYYFRSTLTDLEMEAPTEIQSAVRSIFSIMRRTFVSNKNELHDRLQWPLFLAGIEVEDEYYRDWIIAHLSKRPREVLEMVAEAQDATKPRRRMEIRKIRSLLYGNGRDLPADSSMEFDYAMNDFVP